MLRALTLTWILALPLGDAVALGGQNMVLGRMVQARSDAPSVATTASPRARYVLHCAGCHGFDGAGSKSAYVPDIRRLGQFLRIPGGREFIVSVPGVMGSGLNDQQVAEVTNWILAGMAKDSVPEGTPPYTTEEVARARSAPLLDVMASRQHLIGQAKARGVLLD